MIIHKYILLLLSFFSLLSCRDNYSAEGAVKKLYGKKITINWEGMISVSDSSGYEIYAKCPYKIIAKFENEVCTPCFVNHLEACQKFLKTFPKDSLAYLCMVPANKEDVLDKINIEDFSDLCIISDPTEYYSSKNRIGDYTSFFQTFLLDSNDRIMLVGDPLRNNRIKELYNKTIKRYSDD